MMDRKDNMPIWVFLGLMNIYTRKGGLVLFWCSLVFGLLCIPVSYFELIEMVDWTWVVMMAALSAWYWMCIKWVDKHSSWT